MLQAALTLWKEDLCNANLQVPAFNTGKKIHLKHLLLEPKRMDGPEFRGNMGVGGGEGFPLPLVADSPTLNTLNLSECLNICL